jgi:hypothetical protein
MSAQDSKAHYFHAEAHALEGRLIRPFEQQIKKQAFVKLEGRLADLTDNERERRNYFSQHSNGFMVEGLVSYTAAHTQVFGQESAKHKGASVTVASSVIEGLNILNVVTADRVVAQVSTMHLPGVVAPEVTFLGTHFENLTVFRHKIEPKLNLNFCAGKPATDKHHFVTGSGFLEAVEKQYSQMNQSVKELRTDVAKDRDRANRKLDSLRDLPGMVDEHYSVGLLKKDDIEKRVKSAVDEETEKGHDAARRRWGGIRCSLVDTVKVHRPEDQDGEPIGLFGHMLHVHQFGKVFLAELKVNHNSFHLTMIRLELGCLVDASLSVGVDNVNGGAGGGH